MRILRSAFKHGCRREDIERAWSQFVLELRESDDPVKMVRLGFDGQARLLEVAGVVDHTEVLVIHAMRARSTYVKRLQEATWT